MVRRLGLAPPAVKILPAVVVKQIAKTPALDSQGRAGMLRLRAVGPVGDLAAVEASYEKLRGATESSDLSPELYLFSALFEMRQYDRLEKALANLQQIHPANPSVPVLVATYGKALRNARENAGQ